MDWWARLEQLLIISSPMSVFVCCTTRDGDKNKRIHRSFRNKECLWQKGEFHEIQEHVDHYVVYDCSQPNQIFSEKTRVCLEQICCLSQFNSDGLECVHMWYVHCNMSVHHNFVCWCRILRGVKRHEILGVSFVGHIFTGSFKVRLVIELGMQGIWSRNLLAPLEY